MYLGGEDNHQSRELQWDTNGTVGIKEVRAGKVGKNLPSLLRPQTNHRVRVCGSHLFPLPKWQLLPHSFNFNSQSANQAVFPSFNKMLLQQKNLNSFPRQKSDPACAAIGSSGGGSSRGDFLDKRGQRGDAQTLAQSHIGGACLYLSSNQNLN